MVPPRSSGPSTSSRPTRRSRTQVETYHESTSSDDDASETGGRSGTGSRLQSAASLRSRSNVQRPSYREPSDNVSDDDSIEPEDGPGGGQGYQTNTQAPARNVSRPVRSTRRARTAVTRSSSTNQRENTFAGTKRRQRDRSKHTSSVPGKRAKYCSELLDDLTRVIPPWQTLPYHILFEILLQATYPASNEKWEARSDVARWLVNVACLCREFQEPALAALYYCPPLFPSYKCHALVNLLSIPRESLLINYAGKIKELHVDVDVLRYKSGPVLGYFDLTQLIQKIPQVHAVRLYHQEDFTLGYQPSDIPLSKWTYSDYLFEAMDSTGIRLRAWDWNSRFLNLADLLPFMLKQHQRSAFQRLKEVKLLHLGDRKGKDTPEQEDALASALNVLPDLERLEFVECSLLTDRLLLQLPSALRSITITNCDRIFSPYVDSFLKTRGSHLRELYLNHNRHLDLMWAANLADHCPALEKVKFDGNLYDASPHNDTNPHFESIMEPSIEPTWPSTLREIEMTCLRKLDSDCAKIFLTSLLNVAPYLSSLRRLSISMILDMSWRDRARFRDCWVPELYQTFQRGGMDAKSREPTPFPESSDTAPKRHSARIAQISENQNSDSDSSLDLSGRTVPESLVPNGERQRPKMCDEVFIRIDNQRPSETQFNENDFLDSEASGDEDWDGEDYEAGGGGYAW
ncbi:uncharacterized protein N7469_004700 [Penicillium citrinum]|uniref:Uncharacterized protein n=1 Tax=Penicillium citrinum TaxID=5077 RepID=A0A9W9P574_PENCI|nr:uncharacterized protein N7469_004700 [Penicillium citrinum]KAJ5235532.1 hypothetical protein N7469_004700 [Penicillium citrinum]